MVSACAPAVTRLTCWSQQLEKAAEQQRLASEQEAHEVTKNRLADVQAALDAARASTDAAKAAELAEQAQTL